MSIYQASKHFVMGEFLCPCHECAYSVDPKMDPAFIARLDVARDIAHTPFVINSGRRCAAHNKAVGGKDDSAHVFGKAVDIRCAKSPERMSIVRALIAEFNRIGIYKTHIHVDLDESKPQQVMWYG